MLEKLVIVISKTANGKGIYIQLTSKDQTSVNVVLITKEIEINDFRK